MKLDKIKKYMLPLLAVVILIISSVLYLCIQNTTISVIYTFSIFVVVALLTYYLCFSKENDDEADKK